MNKETDIQKLLDYYMGKNTPTRQTFIIDNLKVEKDIELSTEEEKAENLIEA